MATKKIKINRAPVMTLWAAVVAERLGYDRETALTLGKGVAGLNAQSKGRRLGIFEEGVTLLRRLWTEPEVTFSGRHFQLQEVRLGLRPYRPTGIPLWLAGSIENAQRRVLRLGDGWFPNPPSPQVFAQGWEQLQELAQAAGQDVQALHRCVYTTLNINHNVAQAEHEARAFIEGYYGTSYEAMVRTQGVCAGPAERCVAWLNEFIAAGAQTLVLRFGGPDQMGQLERCAREVLPHVHLS